MTKTKTPHNPHAGKTPLELVKEIHTKALTSGEQCLSEARKILANSSVDNLELYEKIAQRGFGNVKEIAERREQIEKSRLAFVKSKLIEEYSVRYPHKKFIGVEEMDAICKEYNLVMGADQHYTGSMPERSMREIVDFKLNEKDEIYYEGKFRAINSGIEKSTGVIDWTEIDKSSWMQRTNNGTALVKDNKRTHYAANTMYFMVCAPFSMFKTEGLVKEGNELKQLVEVPDPICLKPVRHGYIIVSVWGEEMAIEQMQNPKMN